MSDFEYEDDLDILTSLLDDEDDEEEKLHKKIKTTSSCSSSPFQKRYVNKPSKTSKGPIPKSDDEARQASVETRTRSGESTTRNLELGNEQSHENLPGKYYLKTQLWCFYTNLPVLPLTALLRCSVNA